MISNAIGLTIVELTAIIIIVYWLYNWLAPLLWWLSDALVRVAFYFATLDQIEQRKKKLQRIIDEGSR